MFICITHSQRRVARSTFLSLHQTIVACILSNNCKELCAFLLLQNYRKLLIWYLCQNTFLCHCIIVRVTDFYSSVKNSKTEFTVIVDTEDKASHVLPMGTKGILSPVSQTNCRGNICGRGWMCVDRDRSGYVEE